MRARHRFTSTLGAGYEKTTARCEAKTKFHKNHVLVVNRELGSNRIKGGPKNKQPVPGILGAFSRVVWTKLDDVPLVHQSKSLSLIFSFFHNRCVHTPCVLPTMGGTIYVHTHEDVWGLSSCQAIMVSFRHWISIRTNRSLSLEIRPFKILSNFGTGQNAESRLAMYVLI